MVGEDDRRTDQRGETAHLGSCPNCGRTLDRSDLLVEYRTAEGWPRILAACPACDIAVRPT